MPEVVPLGGDWTKWLGQRIEGSTCLLQHHTVTIVLVQARNH